MPLIVLEGVDASGKATQTQKLYEALTREGRTVRKLTFPDYDSPSSAPVKLYLSGKLGDTADSVSPYAAGALFAVDRYCSYKMNWSHDLERGDIVLADRYVTSNFIHQASKLTDKDERDAYLAFQADFEYNKLGLPKPDAVIFLDVPPKVSRALLEARANKFEKDAVHDIHERDEGYLERSYESASSIADAFGFLRLACTENGAMRPVDDIAADVLESVRPFL